MRHISSAAISLLFLSSAYAQSPWSWARSVGAVDYEAANAVAFDSQGNQLLAGQASSAVLSIGGQTVMTAGQEDGVLVKYDPDGNVLWAMNAGGSWYDNATCVATDPDDNVILGGWMDSTATVGDGNPMTSAGYNDCFIAKISPAGSVIWSRMIGGPGNEDLTSIAADQDGNILLAGYFGSPSLTIDGITISNGPAGFVAKLDPDGLAQWAIPINGTIKGVSTTPDGSAIICGVFYDVLDVEGNMITSNGQSDGFVAKLSADGIVLWARGFGGDTSDEFNAVDADSQGNIVVAGRHTSDSFSIGGQQITNQQSGYEQALVVKMDGDGNPLWAANAHGGGNLGTGVVFGQGGRVLVTGYFESGELGFGSIDMSPSGFARDGFLVSYSPGGTPEWAMPIGGEEQDQCRAVCADVNGNIGIAGWFSSPTLVLGSSTLTLVPGSNDMFTARMNASSGLPERSTNPVLQAGPNPASNWLRVQCDEEVTSFAVLDPQGRVVLQGSPRCRSFVLDLEGIPAGLHIVCAVVGHEQAQMRFVKD